MTEGPPVGRGPRLAYYGDDVTGSVDALLQLTRHGCRGRLFVGHPGDAALRAAATEHDVVGVAGIARSLGPAELDAEVAPALTALAALSPTVLQYKACSTADSSPVVGNLGRVVEIAGEVLGSTATVPVLFAQPDFGRYTVFGHHFAAEAGRVHRLDRQPTMAHHPATPMRESDLAEHLRDQTRLPIGAVHLTDYPPHLSDDGPSVLAQQLRQRPDRATVLDALTGEHLTLIGRALLELAEERTVFALGSGGLSSALAMAWSGRPAGTDPGGWPDPVAPGTGEPAGPTLVVSGSRSGQTLRQVEHAASRGWVVLTLPDQDTSDPSGPSDAADPGVTAGLADVSARASTELAAGRSVVVTTGPDAGARPDLVGVLGERLGDVAAAVLRSGLTRRLVVCGGDTSTRVLLGLGAESLRIVANPVGNVVICAVSAAATWLDGVEVLLKGGQVGEIDLFERVAARPPG